MAKYFDKIRKEFGAFLKQYKRKSNKTCDPYDRGYDRKIEEKIKRMNPEILYRIICDEENDSLEPSWPFDDPENVAVFTSTHIVNNGKPILYVSHDDEDGAWQFHSGDITSTQEAMVSSLKEILELDSSIAVLAKMPTGYNAKRENINSEWVIRKKKRLQ